MGTILLFIYHKTISNVTDKRVVLDTANGLDTDILCCVDSI